MEPWDWADLFIRFMEKIDGEITEEGKKQFKFMLMDWRRTENENYRVQEHNKGDWAK